MDKDIDFSDIPELADNFFKEAVLWPGKKNRSPSTDPDLVDFYKNQGGDTKAE
jgi:hypothetical protein